MKKHPRANLVVATLLFWSGAAFALAQEPGTRHTFAVSPGLQLQLTVPGDAWVVTEAAPQFLIDEAVEDVKRDLAAAGKTATDAQIADRVREQLASNELYVYNPASKAVLEISFSALAEGESAPSKRTIKSSATAAGESMTSEDGVSESRYTVKEAHVEGVDTAYRLDLDYKADGSPRKFIGLIGFTRRNWTFFYYTDRLANQTDLAQMEQILASQVVRSAAE